MTGKVATERFITRQARREDHAAFGRFWEELKLGQVMPDVDYWVEHLMPQDDLSRGGERRARSVCLTFPFGERGDVRQIAVTPEYRGRGVGKQIMRAVADRFREAGVSDWRLEVRATNAAAIALLPVGRHEVLRKMETVWVTPDVARSFAKRGSVELVEPSDDATLEARWDLGAGQIARWRKARPHAIMCQIRDRALTHYRPTTHQIMGSCFRFVPPTPKRPRC